MSLAKYRKITKGNSVVENNQSEPYKFIQQLPQGECVYCDLQRDKANSFFPPHTASPNCNSGKHIHCTCDVCF
jgi:hypothetical protein